MGKINRKPAKSYSTNPDDFGDIYLRNVPKWLRDMFKAACASRGTSMTAELLKHMNEYVRDNAAPVRLEAAMKTTKSRYGVKR